jgi:hypothetical protein
MEKREPYSIARISELYEYLVFQSSSEKPVDYEVRIDNLIVVRRNNDPERFYDFEPQLKESTAEVLILFFKGSSRVADKYAFVLREVPAAASIQQQIEEAVRRDKEATLIRLEMDTSRKRSKTRSGPFVSSGGPLNKVVQERQTLLSYSRI